MKKTQGNQGKPREINFSSGKQGKPREINKFHGSPREIQENEISLKLCIVWHGLRYTTLKWLENFQWLSFLTFSKFQISILSFLVRPSGALKGLPFSLLCLLLGQPSTKLKIVITPSIFNRFISIRAQMKRQWRVLSFCTWNKIEPKNDWAQKKIESQIFFLSKN